MVLMPVHRVTPAAPRALVAIAALLQAPATALACSGPGAEEAIRTSDRIIFGALLCSVLCFLCGLLVPPVRRRLTWKGVLGLGLAIPFHPALLFGTLRGDCGYTARWIAIASVPLVLGAFAVLFFRGQRRQQRPPTGDPR